MNESLSEDIIHDALRTKIFGRTVYALEEIDSTNRFAKKLAALGRPEGTVVYAEKQTQGRGRWGRSWDSPKGKGLWFSVVLRPSLKPSFLSLLTLLGATSVAEAVERNFIQRLKVRWPNDLYLNGKKVAGILTEVSRNRRGASYVILGIGLNVNQVEEEFTPDVRERAISLRMAGDKSVDRVSLLAELLFQLESDYKRIQTQGFDFVLQRWIARSSILGKPIVLRVNSHVVEGVVKGFHATGDLILLSRDGSERRYSNGDVVEVKDAIRG